MFLFRPPMTRVLGSSHRGQVTLGISTYLKPPNGDPHLSARCDGPTLLELATGSARCDFSYKSLHTPAFPVPGCVARIKSCDPSAPKNRRLLLQMSNAGLAKLLGFAFTGLCRLTCYCLKLPLAKRQ